jgi:hypothetical protein
MPKKKLTKAQVKKKLKTMERMMYDLATDKLGHSDSLVPISLAGLISGPKNMLKITQGALRRLK